MEAFRRSQVRRHALGLGIQYLIYGQLGDGTNIDRKTPIRIGTDTNWSKISAGGQHTLALKTDGTLWAWGYNAYGQLGNGQTGNALQPASAAMPGNVLINNGADLTNNPSVVLGLTAFDINSIAGMQFSNDGTSWTNPEPYAATKSWTLSPGDGTKTVYARFKDAAGNWSSPFSDTIVLDTTPPAVAVTAPARGLTSDNTPLLTYTVSDGAVAVKVDGAAVAKTSGDSLNPLTDGLHTVRVESVDAAGNAGYAEAAIRVVTGLVGLWRMDGDWTDASGNGNNGTAYNGAGFSANARLGTHAGGFDGTDDQVMPANSYIASAPNTFTIELWASPTAGRAATAEANSGVYGTVSQRYAIAPAWGGSTDAGAGVSVGTNGISVFEHGDNYVPSLLVYDAALSGWNHIVVVYENKRPRLYLNGQYVRTGLASGRTNVYPSVIFGNIGNYGPYQGMLDDVVVYNRALNDAEIAYRYQSFPTVNIASPAAGYTNDNTPLLAYTASEGAATVKVDGAAVSKVSGDSLDALPDGEHAVRVETMNSAGEIGVAFRAFTVDTALPAAAITAPATGASVHDVVQITGTAADANFDSYRVEYGPASGAGPWTLINTSPSAVSNGTLASWTTDDETNSVLVPNGDYLLRLRATDKAGNIADATVPVSMNNLLLSGIAVSASVIDTSLSQSSNVFFNVNKAATVTFKVIPEKDGLNATPAYTAQKSIAQAGSDIFTWDGKNNAGAVVPDEAYLYVLEAADGAQNDAYKPATPAGIWSMTCTQEATYDPYKNDPLTVSYSVAQASRINVSISALGTVYKVLDAVPRFPGDYAVDWDGGADGRMLYGGVAADCSVASMLRENVIMTTGDTPKATLVKTDPYEVQLSYGHFTRIKYALSRAANVTVQIVSATGEAVTVVSSQAQTAGAHEIQWNGLDPSDPTGKRLLAPQDGDYLVTIQAVNPVTGAGSTTRGRVRIGQ